MIVLLFRRRNSAQHHRMRHFHPCTMRKQMIQPVEMVASMAAVRMAPRHMRYIAAHK